MATLGNATGASTDSQASSYLYVSGSAASSGYLATENGTITKVTIKFQGHASGDTVYKAVVYSETAGAPLTQICYSGNVTIPQSASAAEYDFSVLTPATPSIVSGTRYWIGKYSVSAVSLPAVHFYATGSSGIAKYASGVSDPPTGDFPTPSNDTEQMWAYITYTPDGGGGGETTILPQVLTARR